MRGRAMSARAYQCIFTAVPAVVAVIVIVVLIAEFDGPKKGRVEC